MVKERIYLGSKPHMAALEVCDCNGVLQLRLFNGERWMAKRAENAPVRVQLGPADIERLFEFFDDLTADLNAKGENDAS